MGQQPELPGMEDVPHGQPFADTAKYASLATGPVKFRAPTKAIPGLLNRGQFRTQHETGKSGGVLDPSYRKNWETRAGFEASPVYGYVDTTAQGEKLDRVDQYGEYDFTLKPEHRDRVSVTRGDSLGAFSFDEPVTAPINDVASGAVAMPDPHPSHPPRYIEAQYTAPDKHLHRVKDKEGGIPNSRLPLSHMQGAEVHHRLGTSGTDSLRDLVHGDMIEAKGIPVEHNVPETRYQPPLPFTGQELAEQGFVTGINKEAEEALGVERLLSNVKVGGNVSFGRRRVKQSRAHEDPFFQRAEKDAASRGS